MTVQCTRGSNVQLQSFTKLKRSPVHCAMRKGGTGKVSEMGSAPAAMSKTTETDCRLPRFLTLGKDTALIML